MRNTMEESVASGVFYGNSQIGSKHINTQELATTKSTHPNENFIKNVQKWAILDTQLKIVNEKTKAMREMKHDLTREICACVDGNQTIKISDGELRIYEKYEYQPLSYGYIQECLETIIKNPDHIEYIIQYLKDNRETKTSMDIRRVYNKKDKPI